VYLFILKYCESTANVFFDQSIFSNNIFFMSNKRSRRKQTQNFHCPFCENRLWRSGSSKYYLFSQGVSEIQRDFNLTHKKASFLATQSLTVVNQKTWIESFFCDRDGLVWMRLSKRDDGTIVAYVAKQEDWKKTTHTPHPDIPNPSVSEFSYRISRRAGNFNLKTIT
jgi:hypothetical protein